MSHLKLPAVVLALVVLISLACSVATPTPTATPVPPTQAATSTLVPSTNPPATSAPTATPRPAATATRASTPRPTTAPLSSGVLFSEDFSSQQAAEDHGWEFTKGDNVDTTWAANKYIISVKRKNYLGFGTPDGQYTDFGAETEAQSTGSGYAEYGLRFRAGKDSYYIFGVTTDGKYYMQKKVDGEWADQDPVPATASNYVKKGQVKNVIGVLAQGDKISLYINGFMVKTVTDDSISSGLVGVYAGTGENTSAQVAFNRLTILTVEKAQTDWGATPATGQATATPTQSGTGPGTIIVRNTFPGACQANLFGQQEAVIRAEGKKSASKVLPPGRYGAHLAVDIGEVDLNLFYLPPGGTCVITCDAATKSVYNSCR